MEVELRIPTRLLEHMRADLRRRNPAGGETVGFMATRSRLVDGGVVITAHDYRPVDDAGYLRADDVGVRINTTAIRTAMEWAISGEQGVWHVHMHAGRGRPPVLSETDEEDIPRLSHALVHGCPGEFHGLLVLNLDRGIARAWTTGQGPLQVVVREVGWPLRILSSPPRAPHTGARFDRQSFLGRDSTAVLGATRVGIVGAGGGGSHLCQQLVHLGVGELTVFDPDIIEDKNLPRTVGATEADVAERRLKVDIAKRLAAGVSSHGSFRAYKSRWQDRVDELVRCHLVIGAVDTFTERRELEVACRRYLIPYCDIGMDVFAGTHPRYRMAGQVIFSLPGGPCMRCLDFLTEVRLAEEARAYGAVGGRPQVVFANGVLASTAVGLAVDLMTGWTGSRRSGAYLSYDGNSGLVAEHPLWRERQAMTCPHHPLDQVGEPRMRPVIPSAERT